VVDWDDYWNAFVPQTLEEQLATAAQRTGELDLSGYHLTEVPPMVRGYTQLRKLWLHRNQLTALPDWLGDLRRLTLLDVADNELTHLPLSMLCLPNLEVFRFGGNPLDPEQMLRSLAEEYNQAGTEDIAQSCDPEVTIHIPGARPARGAGRSGVRRVLNYAYPRYGMVRVLSVAEGRAVIKADRADPVEFDVSWRDGRLLNLVPATKVRCRATR
jgi:hypothetical protein